MHRSVCKVAAAHGELKTRLASGELAEAEAGCQLLSVLSADATKVHELTAAGTLEAGWREGGGRASSEWPHAALVASGAPLLCVLRASAVRACTRVCSSPGATA